MQDLLDALARRSTKLAKATSGRWIFGTAAAATVSVLGCDSWAAATTHATPYPAWPDPVLPENHIRA